MKSALAVLFLSAFSAAAFPEEKGVLVLDDSNFDDAIKVCASVHHSVAILFMPTYFFSINAMLAGK